MFRPLSKGTGTASEAASGKVGNDALLKALQDARLDEWSALRLLHENTHPGVQGYICNRLPELGEATIERYLLQLVYLAVHKPGQQLERILLTLCKHSFRVAIKAQWLLVALCQDHPKSKALEYFRDQAYKAALEGKWEVPIRTAKLDPLSPNTSQQLSPPCCSPTSSYLATHLDQANQPGRELLAHQQPYRLPDTGVGCHADDSVATQPPGSMVMSPPATAGPGGLSSALKQAGGGDVGTSTLVTLQRKRSGALVCLLPVEVEQRGGGQAESATAGREDTAVLRVILAQQLPQPEAGGETVGCGGGSSSGGGGKLDWLDGSGVAAFAPPIKTSAAATPCLNEGLHEVVKECTGTDGCGVAAAQAEAEAPGPTAAMAPVTASAGASARDPTVAATAATATAFINVPGAVVEGIAAAAGPATATFTAGAGAKPGFGPIRPIVVPPTPSAAPAAGGPPADLAAASIAERIQALKRELGEGEGVSALLERAKQQGMAPVAAIEDDAVLSDDELSNRPMSPLSRLRFDTFGATLDFVETLCDASSSLTSYSQGERQNALRESLEIINHEIERANRREVAIWFPMGRRGDRVLRLSAREAVLLNSREKAPFLLFVEVLEGQNECGDERSGDVDAFAGLSFGADVRAHLDTFGGVGVGLSASMMALGSTAPKLEFGRRETYGIALTGIGAQHQLHFMHSTPSTAAVVAVGSKAATEPGQHHHHRYHHHNHHHHGFGPHCRDQVSDTAAGGRAGRMLHDAASAAARVPGGQPNGYAIPARNDLLASPMPMRAGSASQAAFLEEQAAASNTARRSTALDTDVTAPADGPTGRTVSTGSSGASLGTTSAGAVTVATAPATVAHAVVQPGATEVVIPTRSASSNNIAAIAAAAMAASTSGGAPDSVLASARSSEAGAPGGGAQPLTPRSCSSVSGLPPRPPSASSVHRDREHLQLQLQQQQQQPQHNHVLPVGGISPVNAAKEVSAYSGGQEGGGLLSASNLLRRVFGDRAEAASMSSDEQAPTGSASIIRALDGKFGALGAIASAAAASLPPSVPSTTGSSVKTIPKPSPLAPQAVQYGTMSHSAVRRPSLQSHLTGSSLLERRTQELAQPGRVGTHHGAARALPQVMAVLSDISASLRGEMPMVRVRIVPTSPRDSANAASGPVSIAASVFPAGSNSGGAGATASTVGGASPGAFSLANLGSRAKAALLNQQTSPSSQTQQQPSASDDAAEGGQSKTALLLSRLGWCRKPSAEDDAGDACGTVAGAVTGGGAAGGTAAAAPMAQAAGSSASPTVALGGGASQVTIPVTSGAGGVTAPKRPPGGTGTRTEAAVERPLVRLVLTVATQGVNLDIKSPHRKSRRMPSHEAIELMADKYKIHTLPPPPECGPPLEPMSYGSSGALNRVFENPSEEGEGGAHSAAAAAVQLPGAPAAAAAQDAIAEVLKAEVEAGSYAWPCAHGAPNCAADSPGLLAAASSKTVVLGPPLPPEWESRGAPTAARPLVAQTAPTATGTLIHQLAAGVRCGAKGGPQTSTASLLGSSSQPSSLTDWWKSGPTAVAEAATAAANATEGLQLKALLPAALGGSGGGSGGGAAGSNGLSRPTGLSERPALSLEPNKTIEASGGGGGASATGSLAASLQSSWTRILNRSSAAGAQQQHQLQQQQQQQQPQQQHVPVDSSPSSSAAAAATSTIGGGGGQPKGAVEVAESVSGCSGPFVERQLSPTSVVEGPSSYPSSAPESTDVSSYPRAVWADGGGGGGGDGGGGGGSGTGAVAALPPPATPPRTGTQVHGEANAPATPVGPPSSSTSLAASLQSSLTRILNRTAPAGQQPLVFEGAGPAGNNNNSNNNNNGAGSSAASGANLLGPRGVSPVRGIATSGANGSQAQAPAAAGLLPAASSMVASATMNSAAAAPEIGGPRTQQQPQRANTSTFAEAGQGSTSASASSGLAASLQSSLTRILNRSAPGPQQQQQQPTPAAEAAVSSLVGGSGAAAPGPSPRGGSSPVRGIAIGGGGGGGGGGGITTTTTQNSQATGDAGMPQGMVVSAGSRLSKLLGRMQNEQQLQQQQQQPLLSDPQQQQQQQQRGQGQGQDRGMGMQQEGRKQLQSQQLPGAESVVAAPAPPHRLSHSGLPKVTDGRSERESLEERRRREAQAVYGERWATKVKRIQRESPHGRRQGWALRCVIVKSGDDCRQELLALQLVRTFGDIFSEAGLPLWVRYYEVLVTSNKTALIEMVPNTLSIHTIKSRSPPGTSLSDHFFAKFGRSGTAECTAAQRRFTESLAAYSLICYLLQIKDRHNGNIMIDDDGRVVHIDYGFLLSNSPGGVNFESAPFKLTRELLEVMDSNSDGRPSEMFDYFKVLMIQGFIAVRNCSDRIMLLVKIMSKSGFPCFKGGERALKALEKRLMSSLTEVQCVEHVLHLIAESLDAWRTRQYDYYQRVLNGIL